MDSLYPPGPTTVADDLAAPSAVYKRRAWLAFGSLLLFIALYLALTGWFAWTAYSYFVNAASGEGNDVFIGFGLAGIAAFLTVFLVKALFFVNRGGEVTDMEITAEQHPQLFEFLFRLADEAGAPRPHRVFLSGRVNAAVFYDLTLLNLIFPSKKNLEIGLALVNALNLGELKAVLAHEFGHFRQGSMAVGRWVYVAQQIATHIIQERDILDRFLLGLSRFDLRVAWIGWILRLIVWALRALLDTVFSLVVLAQRSLSREMEFHADLVSVSLTGSDALIHALHRLHAADDAWDRALGVAGQELGEGRAVSDVFVVQKLISKRMKEILDDEFYEDPPPLPDFDKASHRVFETEQVHPPRMWSTHPPNRAREENAKKEYVEAATDERSAWELFNSPQQLREDMTAHLLSGSPAAKDAQKAAIAETAEGVKKQYGKEVFDQRYRGVYLGRSSTREFATADEIFMDASEQTSLSSSIAQLYPESIVHQLEHWRTLEKERVNLQAIYDGQLKTLDGVIRHRGDILKRSDIPSTIETLGEECNEARGELALHDRLVRSVHAKAARQLGNGWAEYHAGLVKLLHYADHSAANISDADGRLANLWAVVMADGKVSSGEINQILVVAEDVADTMAELDKHKDQVVLSEKVAADLKVEKWTDLLDQELGLGQPTRENIGDWLQVVDGWFAYFTNALALLRDEALETLLACERQIEQAASNNVGLEAAPAPAQVPEEYATLLPNAERKRQTRLGAWDRFQTADGLMPGLARFAASLAIIGGLLGLGLTQGSDRELTIYNGLATGVVVDVEGTRVNVSRHQAVTLKAPGSDTLTITATTPEGQVIERFAADSHNPLANYVYNIASAAPLVEWTAVYGNVAEREPTMMGAQRWLSAHSDHLFSDPPNQIDSRGDGGSRTVLSAWGHIDPQDLADYLPEGAEQDGIVRMHAIYDDPLSPYLLIWLSYAMQLDDGPEIVEARLIRDPNDVMALRFEQHLGTDNSIVCEKHQARAQQLPGNSNWQYLAVRCIENPSEQSDGFIRLHEQFPDDPWLTSATAYVHAQRGNWQEALTLFESAFEALPSMRPSIALVTARIMRMNSNEDDAIPDSFVSSSRMLGLVTAIINGEDLSGSPYNGYALLYSGKLAEAVEAAASSPDIMPLVLRLAAASDGAPSNLVSQALELDSETGVNNDTLLTAVALAAREGKDTSALLQQLDAVFEDQADFARNFYSAISASQFNRKSAEKMLEDADVETRGQAYAMAVVLMGDKAPDAWRQTAKRLLFSIERPYFN